MMLGFMESSNPGSVERTMYCGRLHQLSGAKKMLRIAKMLCMTGSILLVVTAVLHGTGYFQVSTAIYKSNSSAFLKHVVPGLWVHFSIHLVVLAIFGVALAFLRTRTLIALLALAVAADAMWVFSLAGFFAGVALLIAAALCFALASIAVIHKSEI